MEDREGFVENSKVAAKGIINGIFGSFVYELLLTILVSLVITTIITSQNPGLLEEEITSLANKVFDSFPFSLVISCVSSLITLVVFAVIIGSKRFIGIVKKLISKETLKYGIIGAIAIMGFSIFYNSVISSVFNIDTGNANQENVVAFIKNNAFFGFLSVVVFAPIVEELTYRYCLFGAISKRKKWMAYVVSGVVFALMHCVSSVLEYGFTKELLIEFLYVPPYLFSGLALCYLYDRTNNLGSSFIAHLLNNLVSFIGIVFLFII